MGDELGRRHDALSSDGSLSSVSTLTFGYYDISQVNALLSTSFVAIMADNISRIGFIGLGLMGLPMVQNLIKKTPGTTEFFVYDVVEGALKEFCDEHSTRAKAMKSSRDVADKAVSMDISIDKFTTTMS